MKKTIVTVAAVALLAAFLCFGYIAVNRSSSEEAYAMDTIVNIKITGFGSSDCLESIKNHIDRLDKEVLSRHEPGSVVSRLNANHGGEIDDGIIPFVETMLDVSKKSGGAFDFTLGEVSDLWGFGSEPEIPDSARIEAVLADCGAGKISLSEGKISFDGTLDFGSTGKGIALDLIRTENLENSKIKSAVISIGGSVLLYGGRTFRVGVADPSGVNGRYIAVLNLSDSCISTSGNYERFFEKDGKRYHHILNPKTGYPEENGLVSVTIVSESGILTDALSTACFVLGLENGMKLAEEYGCESVFVTDSKEIYVSDGLKDSIEITENDYTLR